MAENNNNMAHYVGLSDQEAKEFHGRFMLAFASFVAIAVVAHALVWFWRPWL